MPVKDLGTWLVIAGIREEEEWWREGGWNMQEKVSKENLYHSDNLKGVENLEFLD